jgi:hypothetical protein
MAIALAALWLPLFIDVYRRDWYFGLVYLSLFVYVIFAIIGYVNFPELSMYIGAYFGRDVVGGFIVFIAMSFLGFYISFRILYPYTRRIRLIVCRSGSNWVRCSFLYVVMLHLLYLTAYLLFRGDLLNYSSVASDDFAKSQGVAFSLFIYLFKFSVVMLVVLYCMSRMVSGVDFVLKAGLIRILLLLELSLFVVIAAWIGNRSDIVSAFVGIVAFEFLFARVGFRKILVVGVSLVAVIACLTFLEKIRGGALPEGDLMLSVLNKDYYAPAHILFAAMSMHFVDLWTVVSSNFCNAFVLLNYPYLTSIVASKFNPNAATKAANYAFYIFSEGYLALGWLGWIYNSTVVFLGFYAWRLFACCDNKVFRLFAGSILASQVINLVRGQSSSLFKIGYMYLVPALIVFFIATGYRPKRFVWYGKA